MVDNSELLQVPVFADLPGDQIAWFISQAQESFYKAGDVYSRQGDPADAMFVILAGQIEMRGELGGDGSGIELGGGVCGRYCGGVVEAVFGG